jgi:hypothetical protein
MKIRGATTALALVSLLAAACGGGAGTATVAPTAAVSPTIAPSPTAAPTASPDRAHPVGMIAIGHSGLTGEGTAGEGEPAYDSSWATGTSVDVDSIYLRITAVRPEYLGHVANTAQGGAKASALVAQATSALSAVPVPAFALISTIDNDIQCDGQDLGRVAKFGQDVASGIKVITTASPNVKILVIGQFGRPNAAFLKSIVAKDPTVLTAIEGDGPCDAFDPSGKLLQSRLDYLTTLIDAFEAEETRVCGLVPQCSTDGGVRKSWVDHLEYFSPDWNHLNVLGQAAEAKQMWPVVAQVLGL